MTESTIEPLKPRRNLARWQVIAVVLIFTGPFIASHLLNANLDRWSINTTKNHGSLVSPMHALPEATPSALAGLVKDNWTLLYMTGNDCDEACRSQMYNMRQARMAQGRQMYRIQGVFVSEATLPETTASYLATEHVGLNHYVAAADSVAVIKQWLAIDGAEQPTTANLVYLIDPLGNLMMVYDQAQGARAMIDDLAKLLKLSKIG